MNGKRKAEGGVRWDEQTKKQKEKQRGEGGARKQGGGVEEKE